MNTDLTLDALEQALRARQVKGDMVLHRGRGSHYLSIRYTEWLSEVGIDLSVGSVGDSYDNVLAESVSGLFKAKVIRIGGPWRSL